MSRIHLAVAATAAASAVLVATPHAHRGAARRRPPRAGPRPASGG